MQPYLVRTHNMSGQPKTGEKLLEVVQSDIQYIKEKFDVNVIAWCTDDGPDGKKMRQLLKLWYLWIIVLVCWAHQINLVVGEILCLKLPFLDAIKNSLEVIKWFNSHGTALALLQSEQRFSYSGKAWALILPVVTWWTAHYLSCSRLLKVKGAVRSCCSQNEEVLQVCVGLKQEAQDKAAEILSIVGNDRFWIDLIK